MLPPTGPSQRAAAHPRQHDQRGHPHQDPNPVRYGLRVGCRGGPPAQPHHPGHGAATATAPSRYTTLPIIIVAPSSPPATIRPPASAAADPAGIWSASARTASAHCRRPGGSHPAAAQHPGQHPGHCRPSRTLTSQPPGSPGRRWPPSLPAPQEPERKRRGARHASDSTYVETSREGHFAGISAHLDALSASTRHRKQAGAQNWLTGAHRLDCLEPSFGTPNRQASIRLLPSPGRSPSVTAIVRAGSCSAYLHAYSGRRGTCSAGLLMFCTLN